MSYRACISVIFILTTGAAIADDSNIPIGNDQACMDSPLTEFGQYIGDWNITDSRLSQDGTRMPGGGAR